MLGTLRGCLARCQATARDHSPAHHTWAALNGHRTTKPAGPGCGIIDSTGVHPLTSRGPDARRDLLAGRVAGRRRARRLLRARDGPRRSRQAAARAPALPVSSQARAVDQQCKQVAERDCWTDARHGPEAAEGRPVPLGLGPLVHRWCRVALRGTSAIVQGARLGSAAGAGFKVRRNRGELGFGQLSVDT